MSKIEVTDAMIHAALASWDLSNGTFRAAIEAAFAVMPQSNERRVEAERAVIDEVLKWTRQDCAGSTSGIVIAGLNLRVLDTPPDLVGELLAAMRVDPHGRSQRVFRAVLALECERKRIKS